MLRVNFQIFATGPREQQKKQQKSENGQIKFKRRTNQTSLEKWVDFLKKIYIDKKKVLTKKNSYKKKIL